MTIAQASAKRSTAALWIVLTVLVGLLLPFGGFVIAGLSRVKRWRDSAPSLKLLLIVAAAVLVVQVIGLIAWPSGTLTVGPVTQVS